MKMSRLADYFVVVGYDYGSERNIRNGKILQRFPKEDWQDTPFIEGIEWFCQPLGWNLSTKLQEPSFFVAVLTDIDANRHYCACFCFYEPADTKSNKSFDDEEEGIDSTHFVGSSSLLSHHHSVMYAPKCLVLVSRLDYTETFRNCLGTIYTVFVENLPFPLETLIGNILGCIKIPPPGGPQVRFSIGAGDKQAIQPPLSSSLPITGNSVSALFKQFGISNCLTLFWSVMTEHKILFHSNSFSRLTECCRALTSLIYPFRYSHVYIPILPASLLEVLSTPTPFIIGIHSSLKNEIEELLDIIVADIDGGSIHAPGSLASPIFSSSLWVSTQDAITNILQPELRQADLAFSCESSTFIKSFNNTFKIDKQIRAVFMKFFVQLLQGYRSFLNIIRIHPKPIITFNKIRFLANRNLADSDFLSKVLDSMFFTGFVNERGPPWRVCDAWDELYLSSSDILKFDAADVNLISANIQEVSQILFTNENPNPQQYNQRVLKPPLGAFSRIHQPIMCSIVSEEVETIISEGMVKNNIQTKLQSVRNAPRIVPMEVRSVSFFDGNSVISSNRRIEVLRTCISNILENKIGDAKKFFPAVLRTLKQREARETLCFELTKTVHGNKAVLDDQQFDLITKLMNKALADETYLDENGIAAQILPLSNIFCRKLCTGVIQFAYTCIQDHPVWKNLQFWETSFYQDVQKQIKALYLAKVKADHSVSDPFDGDTSVVFSRTQEPSALEIAAEQMRLNCNADIIKQKEQIQCEESTLYSQAIHYANRMVALMIPLDIQVRSKSQKQNTCIEDDTSVSNSVIDSRSYSHHSDEGFDEAVSYEIESTVAKFISRFIDRVCTEGGVTPEHLRNLHAMVPGVVHMHIESLEAVYRESKRCAPIPKQKIKFPALLSGEKFLSEPIRAFLIADGRDTEVSPFIPAEGALFLTNYRIIFLGSPCDQLVSEQNIVRLFPVASLTREKRISIESLSSHEQFLPEGLQIRSCTFQLLKIAFDSEIQLETIENFRKLLNRTRYPPNVFGHFAFSSCKLDHNISQNNVKEKNSTLKGFAKKTLLRTAKKAGFKQKSNTKRKYVLPDFEFCDSNGLEEDNYISDGNNEKILRLTIKDIEKLKQQNYVRDWERLGFFEPHSGYRLSTVNCNYSLCQTYPSILVTPSNFSDEQLKSLSRCYKNQRIPLATWRNSFGVVLFRGATPHNKTVIGMLKNHPHSTNTSNDLTGYFEQDRYFSAVIENMPNSVSMRKLGKSDSISSLNSFLLSDEDRNLSLTENRSISQVEIESGLRASNNSNSLKIKTSSKVDNSICQQKQIMFHRVPLYLIGEKCQYKSARLYEMSADFVPVDFTDIRHSRIAFKKLTRACLPSSLSNELDQSFSKLTEQSQWLQQIRTVLQLSGAIVDLIDLQGSSVTIGLEDGWDVTAQISSIAQLCLDPFYRTIEGFRILIEKEWLAFGHRFVNRSNLKSNSSSSSSFAPIFLQFLDCVYQLLSQFPLEFEFNSYFLKFIAFHSVSCRFQTFLFDYELERQDASKVAIEYNTRLTLFKHSSENSTESDNESFYSDCIKPKSSNNIKICHSVFDFIDAQNTKSPIFFNFMFSPSTKKNVLRPLTSIAVLELWSFYMDEELGQGPSYDPELATVDEDDVNEPLDCTSKRKVITKGYDTINKYHPTSFSRILEDIKQTEADWGLLPQKWRQVWEKLELSFPHYMFNKSSTGNALVRSHSRFLHKKTTLEILMLGKLPSNYQEAFSHPHRFENHPFTTPLNCHLCDKILWGPIGVRCMDCGNSYHEKCTDFVPKNCTKYKIAERMTPLLQKSQADSASVTSSVNTVQNSSKQLYDQFKSNVIENRTHEGHLYKRGALLKAWKQRWFVLDYMKHQLRYYDAVEDSNCKGFIDLAEVQFVGLGLPSSIGTKAIDERAFFDLKTNRRTYNFYALSASMAQEWIEKIEGALL